jgi:hypothetical protein
MFKGVSQCFLTVGVLWSIQPLSYLFTSQPPFFNRFQYTSLYPLPSQMLCFIILQMLYHSLFLSLVPWVPKSRTTVTNMFYTSLYMIMLFFGYIYLSFGSIFHIWEKTHGFCLSESGLLHLIWWLSVAPIYFQTTCFFMAE